jgi:DNA-binding NarL/FixJ family response regulator
MYKRVAVAIAVFSAALLVLGGLGLAVLGRAATFGDYAWYGSGLVLSVPSLTLGLVVATRRPGNPVGALLAFVGFAIAFIPSVETYSVAAVRIVIGEDSALFREGLARLLADAGHEIVAKVGDADALLAAVEEHEPDLAIVDIRMPPDHTDDGARAAAALRQRRPQLGILLLSQQIETCHSVALVAQGGFGYLLKDRVFDVDDFLEALRRIASGGSALDPEVVARLLAAPRRSDPLTALTPREREVLALMAEGRTNVGIARRLWLTDRTVETHVGSIMAKLGLAATDEDHRRVLAVVTYLRATT